jgi:ADP-ribosylglycohydrolase
MQITANSTRPGIASGSVAGALVGLAVGDCLGAPFEGRSAERIARWDGQGFAVAAPVWTDDTQQALVLADDLARHGSLDAPRVAARFVAMRDAPAGRDRRYGLHRGTGSGFRGAIDRCAAGADVRTSGAPDRIGNGASMRIAPVAVALAYAGADPFDQIVRVSLVTHRHRLSLLTALAVARVAEALARSGSPSDHEVARRLLLQVADTVHLDARRLEDGFGPSLTGAAASDVLPTTLVGVAERIDDPFNWIVDNARRICPELYPHVGPGSGHALLGPISAIALAVRARSFHDAVVEAVRLGGDTDTTAAITGALAGAAYRLAAIPDDLRQFPGEPELAQIGRALEGANGNDLPDQLALEARLCRTRDAARAAARRPAHHSAERPGRPVSTAGRPGGMHLDLLASALQLGDAAEHGSIGIVPVFPLQTPRAVYTTFDAALPLGFRVTEVSEAGSVGQLAVHNPLDVDVLLYDGEELIGAKQNRILDVTIVVPAEASVTIPVSCVEQGRWSSRSAAFGAARHAANPELRRRKSEVLSARPPGQGVAQGEVWRAVGETAARLGAHSPTAAHADSFAAREGDLAAQRAAFPLAPGQCGAAVAIGSTICLDYVSRPEAWAKLYPKLLEGYLLDALGVAERPAVAAVPAFVASVAGAATRSRPSPGAGTDVRIAGKAVSGAALTLEDELLQLSAFSVVAAPRGHVQRPSRRRPS